MPDNIFGIRRKEISVLLWVSRPIARLLFLKWSVAISFVHWKVIKKRRRQTWSPNFALPKLLKKCYQRKPHNPMYKPGMYRYIWKYSWSDAQTQCKFKDRIWVSFLWWQTSKRRQLTQCRAMHYKLLHLHSESNLTTEILMQVLRVNRCAFAV